MREIITYRLSETGVWGYEFRDAGRERIGSVRAAAAPDAPAGIEGPGISWYSAFDMDSTIVPGIGRCVMDSRTGQELYRLIFRRPGLYQARPADGEPAQVVIFGNTYLFGKPGEQAVAVTERIREAEKLPGQAMSPWSRTTVYEDVGDGFLMMVLSFPALRFY